MSSHEGVTVYPQDSHPLKVTTSFPKVKLAFLSACTSKSTLKNVHFPSLVVSLISHFETETVLE